MPLGFSFGPPLPLALTPLNVPVLFTPALTMRGGALSSGAGLPVRARGQDRAGGEGSHPRLKLQSRGGGPHLRPKSCARRAAPEELRPGGAIATLAARGAAPCPRRAYGPGCCTAEPFNSLALREIDSAASSRAPAWARLTGHERVVFAAQAGRDAAQSCQVCTGACDAARLRFVCSTCRMRHGPACDTRWTRVRGGGGVQTVQQYGCSMGRARLGTETLGPASGLRPHWSKEPSRQPLPGFRTA